MTTASTAATDQVSPTTEAIKGSEGKPVQDFSWTADLPYFPTTVGDTWTEQIGDDPAATSIRTVSAVREESGAKIVTVSLVPKGAPGDARPVFEVTISESGLSRRMLNMFDTRLKSDPTRLLELPIRVGSKWDFEVAEIPKFVDKRHGNSKVVAEEEVAVVAGKFKAVRVETDYFDKKGAHHTTSWYARGVGEVKRVYDGGSSELVKFIRGPK